MAISFGEWLAIASLIGAAKMALGAKSERKCTHLMFRAWRARVCFVREVVENSVKGLNILLGRTCWREWMKVWVSKGQVR